MITNAFYKKTWVKHDISVTKKLFILLPLLGLKYAGRMWVSMFCFAIPVPPDNDTKSAKEFTSHHPVEKFYY